MLSHFCDITYRSWSSQMCRIASLDSRCGFTFNGIKTHKSYFCDRKEAKWTILKVTVQTVTSDLQLKLFGNIHNSWCARFNVVFFCPSSIFSEAAEWITVFLETNWCSHLHDIYAKYSKQICCQTTKTGDVKFPQAQHREMATFFFRINHKLCIATFLRGASKCLWDVNEQNPISMNSTFTGRKRNT